MITDQHKEELLNTAFVQAVAAMAGSTTSRGDLDYGVDITFNEIQRRQIGVTAHGTPRFKISETGIKVDAQLKATIGCRLSSSGCVTYDLDAEAYNDHVLRNSNSKARPIILIVMCLPRHKLRWMGLSPHELVIRNCCYWVKLSGATTSNTTKIAVPIPVGQRFSPSDLNMIYTKIQQGTF